MRYVFIFIFIFQVINAGREFEDNSPKFDYAKKLHEFILRHKIIITQLNCVRYCQKEYENNCTKFQELWDEINQCKKVFAAYFITGTDPIIKQQNAIYNEFISSIAQDRKDLLVAGESMTEYLNRNHLYN